MLKQSVTYVDFNDTTRTEDLFFNLTTAELLALDKSMEGGFEAGLTKALNDQNMMAIYGLIQKVILTAYGQKSEDGRFFKKTPEITAEFEASAAFQAMMDDFIENPGNANSFVTGILPKNLREKAAKAAQDASNPALNPAT